MRVPTVYHSQDSTVYPGCCSNLKQILQWTNTPPSSTYQAPLLLGYLLSDMTQDAVSETGLKRHQKPNLQAP